MMNRKVGEFRFRTVALALLCGGALVALAETANNLFVSVTGPGVKVLDGTTFSVTGDVSQIEVKAMPGWRLKTPELQVLKSNRSGRWRVTSLLGEDAEGGDVCHPSEESVENHVRAPQVAATIQSDSLSYVYAAPATGVVVSLSASSELLRQARHEIVTTRHSCPGTDRDEVSESTEEVDKEPDTYRWNWSFGGGQGTASGASFTTSVTNVPKGVYTVGAGLAASVSDCSECGCSANASADLVVSELRVEIDPWLGIDRTDAATPPWSRTATATLDPCPPESASSPTWGYSGVLDRFESLDWNYTVSTTNKFAASLSYLADEVRATVAGVTAVTNLTVVNLDVAISGVSEEEEETIGAFIGYAPDADADGTWTEEGTNKLVAVSITCEPSDLPTNEMVTVSAPAGFLYEKIGDDYFAATNVYKACEIGGKQFFLHGHASSLRAKDRSITVRHAASGAIDTAKFTSVELFVTNIKFNHDTGSSVHDAINIRESFSLPYDITNGEWSNTGTNYPACYVTNTEVMVKVRLEASPFITNAVVKAVRSDGTILNDVVPQFVEFVNGVSSSGDNGYVTFTVTNKTPGCVARDARFRWNWQAERINGVAGSSRMMNTTGPHILYNILGEPQSPWKNDFGSDQNAWTRALDFVCSPSPWAAGTTTLPAMYSCVTRAINTSGRFVYDSKEGAPHYLEMSSDIVLLTDMLTRISGRYGKGSSVNCLDCANFVVSLANLTGGNLWCSRMGRDPNIGFNTNQYKAIGCREWIPPRWGWHFRFHEVAWSGNCNESDTVFDACLEYDENANYNPFCKIPVLPVNVIFSDGSSQAPFVYRECLTPDENTGYGDCIARPDLRKRRAFK